MANAMQELMDMKIWFLWRWGKDKNGRRVQRIKIVYSSIGEFDPPVSASTSKQEKSA
ncbi:MAG TPA: hypothetical protein GXX18_07205 [Bacillales bacterium]|nr:hypothetical protein [Bacillales bacterium]